MNLAALTLFRRRLVISRSQFNPALRALDELSNRSFKRGRHQTLGCLQHDRTGKCDDCPLLHSELCEGNPDMALGRLKGILD
jgi:hypothetical protein